jgi:peroxiredoxin-like protein
MKPLPHCYSTHVSGSPSGYGEISSSGVTALRTAPPAQFDGPGDAWSPEQFFLAAVASCFLFTLRAVARASKVEFVGLELDAEGVVDRRPGPTRFVEIVLRAALVVPAGTDQARARAALEKTESPCLVSASISTPVQLEADVREAPAAQAVGQ